MISGVGSGTASRAGRARPMTPAGHGDAARDSPKTRCPVMHKSPSMKRRGLVATFGLVAVGLTAAGAQSAFEAPAVLRATDVAPAELYAPRGGLTDVRSGVICSPNNFEYTVHDGPEEGMIRMTALASFDRWTALTEQQYKQEKVVAREEIQASAARYVPDFRSRVVATDTFTPKTIRHFTGHDHGAVYGAPQKRRDGTTHLRNLFVCGTDQGWVGIVGAMMSGVVMANRHCLQSTSAR
jgi:phytoene dehydrogenase-like protein